MKRETSMKRIEWNDENWLLVEFAGLQQNTRQ